LDDQVLAFIKIIALCFTKLDIHIPMKMKNLDEQQRCFMDRLLKIFRKRNSQYAFIDITTCMGNIPFLPPDMENKTRQISSEVYADTDIPLLMEMLATPRPDGQQRMIRLFFEEYQLAMRMVDAIKQVEKLFTLDLSIHI
jgi:hypothetical protein